METIEVTKEVKELLDCHMDNDCMDSYSKVIEWLNEEVFDTRMSTISDSDFGRS